jgi:hypothetical protein
MEVARRMKGAHGLLCAQWPQDFVAVGLGSFQVFYRTVACGFVIQMGNSGKQFLHSNEASQWREWGV